MLIKLVI
jgi:hypothetical protein